MEKILYTEITALANSKGYCYATNSYFANLYDVHKNTAGTWINKLEKLGYIKSKIIYETGTKNVKERRLYIITSINEKIDTPINKKIEDNNTRYNNTRYNNKKINKKEINKEKVEIESVYKSKEFKKTFYNFVDMRYEIKKIPTKIAIKMIIKKLEKVGNEELAIQMLERSIINSWQDVYEIQERGNDGKKSTTNNKREVITRDYNEGAEIFNQ